MSEDTQNPQAQAPAAYALESNEAAPAKLHATKAECEAAKPADAPKGMRPFEVSKGGVVLGWINARGYDHGLAMLARRDGYTVGTGVKQAPVTKEAILSKLGELSDDELAALGLSLKKGKK
jgi:hypothetical protein